MPNPFIFVAPGATRGMSIALTRQFLRTTNLPVFASHRTDAPDEDVKKHILKSMSDVDPKRLNMLRLNLTSEDTIKSAADVLADMLQRNYASDPYIHTAFLTGGVLFPEKSPDDLDGDHIRETFQINVIAHLLLIKHFSRFLPSSRASYDIPHPSKWVHITARVGSIADNQGGGWYSYRASKAALNQVIKTFDLHLKMNKINAMSVGVHPGTVKTDLSKAFWKSTPRNGLFEPEDAATNLINVVENLRTEQRGKVWDWAGQEIPW